MDYLWLKQVNDIKNSILNLVFILAFTIADFYFEVAVDFSKDGVEPYFTYFIQILSTSVCLNKRVMTLIFVIVIKLLFLQNSDVDHILN